MWPGNEETQLLITEAKGGDAAALDRLLARYRDGVRRMIALRLDPVVSRRVDASDIVQDVLLEASRRFPEYAKNPVMPFHLWLRQMAKDGVIDAHRRHRQAQKRSMDREQSLRAAGPDQSSLDLAAAAFVDPQLTPASAAVREEMKRRFAEALTHLSDDDREVILMRHFEQVSNQELAAILDLTEPAAAMRYLRAIRRLKTLLEPKSDTAS
jgi:RNA polymerase sigma-70 factor (ECF subfamily)